MPDGKVDREAWAQEVRALLAEVGGNKSRFAAMVGTTYKTVTRWLNKEVDVSEESIRDVARAMSRNPRDLLTAVGYYSDADLSPAARDLIDPDDPEVQQILAHPGPEWLKRQMIDKLLEMRERDRDRRMSDMRWLLRNGIQAP